MKGDPKVIEVLNQALRMELTAINQYFLHYRMLQSWGYEKLAKKEYEESIDEMKHADALIERILFLEGLPNLQDLDPLYIGEDVVEILRCDLKREHEAHPMYKESIGICEKAEDYVSRRLLVEIQHSEEEHIDYLEAQLALVDQLGVANFLQSQVG
ncbi:MAG: bacterioferritin [Algiphilus sp.]